MSIIARRSNVNVHFSITMKLRDGALSGHMLVTGEPVNEGFLKSTQSFIDDISREKTLVACDDGR